MRAIRKIKIEGFKSIASAELELGDLNVVIGANGSGKSNLIGAFRLLERVCSRRLQAFVAGEPDRLLHHGRKVTPTLSLAFVLGGSSYGLKLRVQKDTLVLENERASSGEELLREPEPADYEGEVFKETIRFFSHESVEDCFPIGKDFFVYHFHDTSDSCAAKQASAIDDNRLLRPDAANVAAYLYWLQEKQPVEFRNIEEHVRLVAPFFDGFILAPSRLNERKIKLEWRHRDSDAYFDAYSLSDGTLRFICLATLLLQPSPPPLILLDEPELGLHPSAIHLLAEMLEAASTASQVLLATQSVALLDYFSAKDVIVAENSGLRLQTTFRRLDEEKLRVWLDNFSLGELWEKNVLGGRP